MEAEVSKMRNVGVDDGWSLGNTQLSSGRLRKVSIGITVENQLKLGHGTIKEDAAAKTTISRASFRGNCQHSKFERQTTKNETMAVPTTTRVCLPDNLRHNKKLPSASKEDAAAVFSRPKASSVQDNAAEGTTELNFKEQLELRHTEINNQKAGAWVSTKSVHHVTPTQETVQFHANRTSVLQSEYGLCKKLDTIGYEKRSENGEHARGTEEVTFATVQEIFVPEATSNGPISKVKAGSNNDALKLKLWEILGTAPSQSKHNISMPSPRANGEHLCRGETGDGDEVNKGKQTSDPIESDSEDPNQSTRRPITRSLTRRRISANTGIKSNSGVRNGKKQVLSSSMGHHESTFQNNVFAFNEGDINERSSGWAVSNHSAKSNSKVNEGRKLLLEPRKIYFSKASASEISVQKDSRKQTSRLTKKVSIESTKELCSPCVPCKPVKSLPQKPKVASEISYRSHKTSVRFPESPLAKSTECQAEIDKEPPKKRKHRMEFSKSSLMAEDADHQKNISSPLPPNGGSEGVFRSPTFARNISPSSSQRNLIGKGSHSSLEVQHVRERQPTSESFHNLSPSSSGSKLKATTSDDTTEVDKMQKDSPFLTEASKEKLSSASTFMEDMDNYKADNNTSKGFADCINRDSFFNVDQTLEDSPLTLRKSKRLHGLEEMNFVKKSLPSPSPSPSPSVAGSRTEDTMGPLAPSEQYPNNSLARAVVQLAHVLERFKSKIQLNTRKKSSEIISSASENIRQQLLHAENQIQEDAKKFINTNNVKRKRLELQLQEHQDYINLMHEKFKEELNQQLLNYKVAMNELEEYQLELRKSADRQKLSHKKLVSGVEEAAKAQIDSAETRVSDIHKDARKKMNGLKCVLKEWVGEDGLS